MNFLLNLFNDLGGYLSDGGIVMLPMVVATIVLWFGIAHRITQLRRGTRETLREVMDRYLLDPEQACLGYVQRAAQACSRVRRENRGDIHQYLDETLFGLSEEMRRYRALVKTIVLVAPLAGLLGTVSGMIEMFDSLGSQTFYSQTGGIANGISQALFTTQFGLVIAIPGMIIGRALDRREDAIREEFDQMKEYYNVILPEDKAAGGIQ